MLSILKAQWIQLRRNPVAVLIMTGLTIMMTLIIGGQTFDRISVSVLPAEELSSAEVEQWLELLNESELFSFTTVEETAVLERLRSSQSGLEIGRAHV